MNTLQIHLAGTVSRRLVGNHSGLRGRFTSTLSLACSLLIGLSAFGQSYESNDLTPFGTVSGKFSGASGGKQVGGSQTPGSSYSHAVLVNGNALTATDLHPAAGYYYSMATCADDSQQGGWGYSNLGGIHALVWSGSAASRVDLNPSGYNFSYCLGVHLGEQVGYAQNQVYFVTASHAMSWHGSAGSVIDLHTGTYPYSRATSCHDGEEVGYVSSVAYPEGESLGYHTTSHAYRWAGTAASGVDLHPAGYDASEALATSGTQQGGWGYMALGTSHLHALLWSGDAASVVDLHPAGYSESRVNAMTATQQVGEGWIGAPGSAGSVRHALAWSGTAASVIDLNQYLPAGYTHAVATGVDASGNVVGYAYNNFVAGVSIPPGAIAVVFAPGQTPAGELSSMTLTPSNVAPGDVVQAVVTLGGPAPAGGVNISFASSAGTLVAPPAPIVIPESESQAAFTLPTGGTTLTVPTALKFYATDGVVSQVVSLTLTPVVKPAALTLNAVEGGFSTYGTVSLNIPAQVGGATVALASSNPSLATVPASVMIPQGYSALSFTAGTTAVATATSVPVTATFNGQTVTGSLALSPAPVVSLSGLTGEEIVGGQPMLVTVSLNNFPRAAGGAVISLTSGDASLQVPSTVTVPYGAYSTTVTATSSVVSGRKGVSLKATYNGSSLTTTVFVDPIPTVTITQADYLTDTHMFKVAATTTFTNAILTYGGSPDAAPLGTMQFEQGVFKGSMILDTPPTRATVWNSLGGMATVAVTLKTSSAATGGGGGGGSTSTTFKLTVTTNGKGSVAVSPAASSYAAGTVVTLTATPAAGSPWIGWSGAVTGTANPTRVTITKDTSVTANFR